ncbi:A-kinase anchor protein 11 isoform X3 [Narcine bancroftii]|uniref:A-kinase anchor protein 11 isoform X3 n=1 Tax=Narcine bancroftii TaxID=1343680 RepID=UPI003831936E
MENRTRSGCSKPRISLKKEFLSGLQQLSMKSLLQTTRPLCNVTVDQHWKETDNLTEALAAHNLELSDWLSSLQLSNLKNTEIAFLTDSKKPSRTKEKTVSQVVCVMRHPPSSLYCDGCVFSLLSKYTAGIRFSLESCSTLKHQADTFLVEEDDTNQSVSSIEDDFVTAFEHLEEEVVTAFGTGGFDPSTPKHQQDVVLQTFALDFAELAVPVESSPSLIFGQFVSPLHSNSAFSGPPPSAKSSVITLRSGSGRQRSFYKSCNASELRSDNGHKSGPSVSPSESEDSEGSSPSPVIFLDEVGYQRSLKAKLKIPQIPILKDDIEDSDSEVSEFFDSFDQFDELDSMLMSTSAIKQVGPSPQNPPQKKKATVKLTSDFMLKQCTSSVAAMNPQKFDHPILPADVRKPTARKAESPYNSLSDVPDSPRPLHSSGEENSPLFSPIHSSAFSPLAALSSPECLGKMQASNTETIQAQDIRVLSNGYSQCPGSVSQRFISSVFRYPHAASFEHKRTAGCPQDVYWSGRVGKLNTTASTENFYSKPPTAYTSALQTSSNTFKESIQQIAAELVEKSFGAAFKDLQKGVSSCTSALCHLAARLTSSVIHMALQEIGARRASSRKRSAINGLADYLVGDAIAGALRELEFVKKQIFNNTVARFATDLTEELIFEGVMEVCQFSHPTTPMSTTSWSIDDEEKVVSSYARDLSESVLQEAFIELSQVDVSFTAQAAISVSLDNIKDVGGKDVTQAYGPRDIQERTLLGGPEGCLSNAAARNSFDSLNLTKKAYTIERALLCVSGIASSVSVPHAAKAFSCNSLDSLLKSSIQLESSESNSEQLRATVPERTRSKSRKMDEVLPMDSVAWPKDSAIHVPCSGHISADPIFHCTEATIIGHENSQNNRVLNTHDDAVAVQTNGKMAAMTVNNFFDLVTPSKIECVVKDCASKSSKQTRIDPVPENQFAAELAEVIVTNSVGEVKMKAAEACGVFSTKPSSQETLRRCGEIPECQLQDQLTIGKMVLGCQPQYAFSQSPGMLRTPPVSPAEFAPSERLAIPQHFAQVLKGHLAEEFPPCTPPPSPTIVHKNLEVKSADGVGGPELSDTLKSLTAQLQDHTSTPTFQTSFADLGETSKEVSVVLLGKQRAGLNEDRLFPEEALVSIEGSLSRSPGTPPPTPQQSFREKSLKIFSRKLKGELAKEFMPVTPPSTPQNHSIRDLVELHQDTEEKAEFVLKLMRSLSEEVLDNEEDESFDCLEGLAEVREQASLSPRRSTKVLEKEELKSDIKRQASQYANQLASGIVSMATEIAAICVEDARKCDSRDLRYFWVSPSDLRKSAARSDPHTRSAVAERNVPEEATGSLSNYAGMVAGEVIRDAKKVLRSKRHRVRKYKRDSYQVESNESSFGEQENTGIEGLNTMADQWSRELVDSVLHLPQGGLMSKRSSCESVTDEYAEYIMKMIGREAGNGEIVVDHYASKLAFRTVKVGLEQAARRIKQKYKRRLLSSQQSRSDNGGKELLRFLMREETQDTGPCRRWHDQRMSRRDSRDLARFAESIAQNITYEVTQKLNTASSAQGLSKSLTDSCLYKRSHLEQMAENLIKKTWTCSIQPIVQNNKRYHSMGSLNDYAHSFASTNRTCEDRMGKSGDESHHLNTIGDDGAAPDASKQKECLRYAEKLRGIVLQCSSAEKQSRSYTNRLSSQSTGLYPKNATRAPWHISKPLARPEYQVTGACQLDVPRIHIDLEQRGLFAEDLISVAIEKAKSNTSLAADSGIGQDGASFTESLATEIMTSAMFNASQSVTSGCLKDGLRSTDSTTSQQLSLSAGDDSTGSWSNLSFEDEHPDETSSFLHLSDSNGNSSSWSSLGLEGDIYEENISFPPSESDHSEDKDEEVQEVSEGLLPAKETLLILNMDLEPSCFDVHLRVLLQWIAASQFHISLVHFKESFEDELLNKNVSGISEEFLQCLRLISNFNISTPNLSDKEMQKVSELCSQLLQGLKQLVKQVVAPTPDRSGHKGELSSHRRKISPQMAPYAHLTIKKPIKNSPGTKISFPGLKGKLITSWEEKVGIAHIREMGYSQGSLRISHHGLYYIYAQTLFRYHADHPISTREYQLIQYVYRKMAKYPKPTLILRGASTWSSGNHNLHSVYQGGAFNLHIDDEIFVTVSNVSLVDIDEASSYLGAFKLD